MPPRRAPRRRPRAVAQRPARRTGGRPHPAVVAETTTRGASRFALLAEPPRSHIVCRVCGRIASVPLDTEAALRLEGIARQRPEGWSVDHVSLSLTGACVRCRQGVTPSV